jgi:hypothetical protein
MVQGFGRASIPLASLFEALAKKRKTLFSDIYMYFIQNPLITPELSHID